MSAFVGRPTPHRHATAGSTIVGKGGDGATLAGHLQRRLGRWQRLLIPGALATTCPIRASCDIVQNVHTDGGRGGNNDNNNRGGHD